MSSLRHRTSPVLLLAVAAFCVFGFLATFEPMQAAKQWTWRAIYVVVGGCSLAGVASSFRRPRS